MRKKEREEKAEKQTDFCFWAAGI